MNKIEKLLQKYCPDGVEFKELGDVCEFKKGQNLVKNDIVFGDIPVIAGGRTPISYHNESNRSGETVTISSSGAYSGFVSYWDIPVFLTDAFSITPIDCLLSKYVFYFLKNNQTYIHNLQKGSGVPHVYSKDVAKIQIPIPPIEIQKEIVKILDTFTLLEAELEAELEARKKQYEYYRDDLLSFGDDEVEWKELGEVGEMIRGNGLQKTDFVENGFPCIHYGQLYTFYGTFANNTKSFCSFELAKKLKIAKYGDVLIAGTSENIEDVNKATGWLGNYEIAISGDMFAFRPNTELNGKFLTYMFQTKRYFDYKRKYARGTKVTRVPSKNIEQFKIPIISLSKQQEIVAILDKFDALVNDISVGLPAELKARRQQYEYYRNKLLTFKV